MPSTGVLIIRTIIITAILLLIDFYVFRAVKTVWNTQQRSSSFIRIVYWVAHISFYAVFIYALFFFPRRSNHANTLFAFLAGWFVLLFIPKIFISSVLLLEDLFRTLVFFKNKFFASEIFVETGNYFPERRRFISTVAMLLAAIPFAGIVHGIWKGRYSFRVHETDLFFDDLPESFEGFKIAQISDLHLGSFSDKEPVEAGVNLLMQQKADMVVFTGDLVNNLAEEIGPWISVFSKISAPYGVFSVLGNHDYGDYIKWESLVEKQANFESVVKQQSKMGFHLLRNENIFIEREGQRIALLGMENWGAGGFSRYGDLNKTMQGVDKNDFKVLLSHDPSHWEKQVMNNDTKIHLTLAGHTHGMQFGVEIPGIKFSPVQWVYKRWAGLYKENNRYLYVNRGFGFIGFPGRVGIWPEITVLKLRRKLV